MVTSRASAFCATRAPGLRLCSAGERLDLFPGQEGELLQVLYHHAVLGVEKNW